MKFRYEVKDQMVREVFDDDAWENMTDEEKLRLLASDGMLVKRPILVGDDFVLIGFKEKEWAEKLK